MEICESGSPVACVAHRVEPPGFFLKNTAESQRASLALAQEVLALAGLIAADKNGTLNCVTVEEPGQGPAPLLRCVHPLGQCGTDMKTPVLSD